MAYILSKERDLDPREMQRNWRAYEEYLADNRSRFPPRAFALATSDWYYDFREHRSPHDGRLEWIRLEERRTRPDSEERIALKIRLLGAYHDFWLEFFYPQVYSYTLSSPLTGGAHGDWRYDEFRVKDDGHVLHEIEWAGSGLAEGRWLIEASNVEFSWVARV